MNGNKVQIGTVNVEMKVWKDRMWFYCSGTSKATGCWDMTNKQWLKVKGQFHYPFTEKVLDAFNVER
jgi:hypothetical protein